MKSSPSRTSLKSEIVRHSVASNCLQPHRLVHLAPLSMGFSKQGYWSGLPFPSPGDLPDPGIKPRSPALQADSLLSEPRGKSYFSNFHSLKGSEYLSSLHSLPIVLLVLTNFFDEGLCR